MQYTQSLFDYIDDHIDAEPEALHRLDRLSHLRMVHGRMCSGHYQGRWLKMLMQMIRPLKVLELGTFTGYSALCMAEGIPAQGRVDTIESFDESEEMLSQIFASYPYGHKVNLIIGDCLEVMKSLDDASYDLIFADADKREYPLYLLEAKRILRPGGWLVADNTLWDGHVLEQSNDPQTKGVKEFNRMVAQDSDLEKIILPLRDGMTIIRKK